MVTHIKLKTKRCLRTLCVFVHQIPLASLELLPTLCPALSPGLYIHSLSTIIAPLGCRAFLSTDPCALAQRDGPTGLDWRAATWASLHSQCKAGALMDTSSDSGTRPSATISAQPWTSRSQFRGLRSSLAKRSWQKYIPQRVAVVFVCLGWHNRIPQTGHLNIRHLFSHSSGGWKSKSRCSRVGFWWDLSAQLAEGTFLLCPQVAFSLCICGARALVFLPLLVRAPPLWLI